MGIKTDITGDWSSRQVWIGDKQLFPGASQNLRNHSPDGFNWGYGGSGPAQLALAILYELTNCYEFSIAYYHTFKREVIARLPQGNFVLPLRDVENWISEAREKDADPS